MSFVSLKTLWYPLLCLPHWESRPPTSQAECGTFLSPKSLYKKDTVVSKKTLKYLYSLIDMQMLANGEIYSTLHKSHLLVLLWIQEIL